MLTKMASASRFSGIDSFADQKALEREDLELFLYSSNGRRLNFVRLAPSDFPLRMLKCCEGVGKVCWLKIGQIEQFMATKGVFRKLTATVDPMRELSQVLQDSGKFNGNQHV